MSCCRRKVFSSTSSDLLRARLMTTPVNSEGFWGFIRRYICFEIVTRMVSMKWRRDEITVYLPFHEIETVIVPLCLCSKALTRTDIHFRPAQYTLFGRHCPPASSIFDFVVCSHLVRPPLIWLPCSFKNAANMAFVTSVRSIQYASRNTSCCGCASSSSGPPIMKVPAGTYNISIPSIVDTSVVRPRGEDAV